MSEKKIYDRKKKKRSPRYEARLIHQTQSLLDSYFEQIKLKHRQRLERKRTRDYGRKFNQL